MLYRNHGNGTFSRVSGGVITNQLGDFDACVWLDYDNDGFLDLFVTNDGANENAGRRGTAMPTDGHGLWAGRKTETKK